jgi:diacylglycerol kinase (ATP)
VIRPVSWLRAVRVLPRLYDGSFVGLPEITTATASRVEVDSAPDCAVEADGETLGGGPFRFEIVPRRLRVVIPPDWRS